jgi:asparagine synthase (glutamine-hydrolysing)
LNPQYYRLSTDDFHSSLDDLIAHQDEPIAGLGVLAQWSVMKLAKQHKVKVLLDGQGGDEILGGYRKYYFFYLKELLRKKKLPRFLSESWHLLTNIDFKAFDIEGIRRYTKSNRISAFLSPATLELSQRNTIGLSSAKSFKEKSFNDITKFSYPILLRYEDRNSMAFSIESRVPFLDYRLVEFLHSLPTKHIINRGFTKFILRESMKSILPEEIRLRKSKLGFATPEDIWMRTSLRSYYLDYFKGMRNPYLRNDKIYQAFKSLPNSLLGARSFQRFYLFDRWYNKHF